MPNTSHNTSFAEVAGGKIVLRTHFIHLLRCRSIPGGWWDSGRRAWLYPATARHARLIRSLIPQLQVSEQFTGLLARNRKVVEQTARRWNLRGPFALR